MIIILKNYWAIIMHKYFASYFTELFFSLLTQLAHEVALHTCFIMDLHNYSSTARMWATLFATPYWSFCD